MDAGARDAARGKALEYLRARGTEATPASIHDGVAAAFAALDRVLDGVAAGQAARRTSPGEWSVQEIVDHLVETHRPGLDELRCLLAGRRPPGEPIPASLQSRAPDLRPWPWLRRELARVHADILDLLAGATDERPTTALAPLVMVATSRRPPAAPSRSSGSRSSTGRPTRSSGGCTRSTTCARPGACWASRGRRAGRVADLRPEDGGDPRDVPAGLG